MKKLIISAIIMIATSGVLFAQTNKQGNGTPGTNKNNSGYVDSDKSGVCDNLENNSRPLFRKQQGQFRRNRDGMCNGQCRSSMQGNRHGRRS